MGQNKTVPSAAAIPRQGEGCTHAAPPNADCAKRSDSLFSRHRILFLSSPFWITGILVALSLIGSSTAQDIVKFMALSGR